jgi:hypothetical protein
MSAGLPLAQADELRVAAPPDNGDVDARHISPVGPPPAPEITNERLVLSL